MAWEEATDDRVGIKMTGNWSTMVKEVMGDKTAVTDPDLTAPAR